MKNRMKNDDDDGMMEVCLKRLFAFYIVILGRLHSFFVLMEGREGDRVVSEIMSCRKAS